MSRMQAYQAGSTEAAGGSSRQVAVPPPLPQAGGHAGPARAVGALKLVVGLGVAALGLYLCSEQVRRAWRTPKPADLGVLGFIVGLGLATIASGGLNLMRRRLGVPAYLIVWGAVGAATFFAVPPVTSWSATRRELAAWQRLEASPKTLADYEAYMFDAPIPRRGTRSAKALLETKAEIERVAALTSGKVQRLRGRARQMQREMEETGEAEYQASIDLTREALAKVYAQKLDELAERVEATTTAAGGKREFPEDPAMRAAFAAVLEQVARSDDDRVYLVFTSENHIAAAADDDEAQTRPAGAPSRSAASRLIPAGDAFSDDQESRRRRVFRSALEESLETAFGDEMLVRIAPLPDGATRQGKVVLTVHCATRRAPGSFELTSDGKVAGTLFNIQVTWSFSAHGADGRLLAKNEATSFPAQAVRFRTKRTDPQWAAYSVMMDSAYYNYCREVTGRLGLIPVKVKEYFTFSM